MNNIISQLFSSATADLNAFIFGDLVTAVSAMLGITLIIVAFFILKDFILLNASGSHDDDGDEYMDAEKLFMKEKRKERIRAMADRMHRGEDYRGDR